MPDVQDAGEPEPVELDGFGCPVKGSDAEGRACELPDPRGTCNQLAVSCTQLWFLSCSDGRWIVVNYDPPLEDCLDGGGTDGPADAGGDGHGGATGGDGGTLAEPGGAGAGTSGVGGADGA